MRSNFTDFGERAPNCPQNHDGQAVMFQMAAFVAVDVKDSAHEFVSAYIPTSTTHISPEISRKVPH
jgi:hypothetical protein